MCKGNESLCIGCIESEFIKSFGGQNIEVVLREMNAELGCSGG